MAYEHILPENVKFGHTDEATALVVDDYPYGFKLRTSIRYWIETKAKKGDRFVSQTLNPKTGRWNKPKASTYSPIGVIYTETETGHVKWTALSEHSTEEVEAAFLAVIGGAENLSDEQRKQLATIRALRKVFARVQFTVRETTSQTPEERAAEDAEQAEIGRNINRAIAVETHRAANDLGVNL